GLDHGHLSAPPPALTRRAGAGPVAREESPVADALAHADQTTGPARTESASGSGRPRRGPATARRRTTGPTGWASRTCRRWPNGSSGGHGGAGPRRHPVTPGGMFRTSGAG